MKTLKTIGTSQKLAATVAVSGGVDSLVLLHWVAFHFGNQIDLYPVYVDHGQRADTERDWACVRTLCSRLPHLKSPTRIRIPKRDLLGSASEAQLRSLRYGVLERFSVSRNAPVVFTAHHADDVLETYLLKLLRGSHPTSLKGMAPKSRKGALWLVRPFLKLHKSELVQYALANRIKWHEDATNSSPKYARNRIRNELLPLIESLRPKSTKKLLTFFSDLEKLSSTLEEARTPSLGGVDQLSSPNGAPSLQL
ncbi:MAG TPA: tRNA lysidine(34) synthetase TilS, partial [Oligoflexia bacterium]|nr:tRNA lysidine(34) synthetase TilS [Oligoflexia bacterium]